MFRARAAVVALIAFALTSCGVDESGESFGDDVYDAYSSGDVDRLAELVGGGGLPEKQRQATEDAMSRCTGADGTTQVIDGEVSVEAKYVAFEVDCEGTRSLVLARMYLDSGEDPTWSVDAQDLPGGANHEITGVDLGPAGGLPDAW